MLSLINWYKRNRRELPWRNTSDPYKIWLSEIILQQTRVNQGLDYYNRFVEKYPAVIDLASANIDDIMLLWQGLGYYSRAINLHATAKIVAEKYNGKFPDTFIELKTLKGIGDYTAAAIASIANNEPVAVLDGNVFRVLSRYYTIYDTIDLSKNKSLFFNLANNLLDKKHPGIFNQAIMELGALICTPKNAKCEECPISLKCLAYNSNTVYSFPVRLKKVEQRTRFFYFFIISDKQNVLIQKRTSNDIWQGLFQFPLFECAEKVDPIVAMENAFFKKLQNHELRVIKISTEIKHILTHQIIYAKFIHIEINEFKYINIDNLNKIRISSIADYAMPRIITRYLDKNSIG